MSTSPLDSNVNIVHTSPKKNHSRFIPTEKNKVHNNITPTDTKIKINKSKQINLPSVSAEKTLKVSGTSSR